ncbi:hypothetical protein GCM10009122_25530 [Fulvivirga kasyanovii]
MEFAVTSPLFIHLIHLIMQTPNGQCICLKGNSADTAVDTRQVSKIQKSLLPSQAEFLDYIMFHGVSEFSKSLRLIHDLALYHSDVSFNGEEKSALFDLKILWEGFDRIELES